MPRSTGHLLSTCRTQNCTLVATELSARFLKEVLRMGDAYMHIISDSAETEDFMTAS